MITESLPISMVIATSDRAESLYRTLESLGAQCSQPAEIIVVDASNNPSTQKLCSRQIVHLASRVHWKKARTRGAASQRNEGIQFCSFPVIGFMDDDILMEPLCFSRLWKALKSDTHLGGVNAMITNQQYRSPGWSSRLVFRQMAGRSQGSYAGRVLGPAVNLLPEDRDDLPEIVPVEWLNTTCTLYDRKVLPNPPFLEQFTGYSIMEDLALSITVAKTKRLANARTARIFHDSQPGIHKSDPAELAEMSLLNRHFVMTKLLERTSSRDYLNFVIWLIFGHVATLARGHGLFFARLRGEIKAMWKLIHEGLALP